MIRFPARPVDGRAAFEAAAAGHVRALHELTTATGEPDHAAIGAYIDANPRWNSGVKPHFSAVQHRKCAYCERMFTDWGDVEHFRPKGAVWGLASRGEELEALNNVRGRTFLEPPSAGAFPSGYWWLAYDWDNLLVACGGCNQSWKVSLFPVRAPRLRAPRPDEAAFEEPLLLDPFGELDPAMHLAFDDLGAVSAYRGSDIGQATIETCGLWRLSVQTSRREKAERTWLLLQRVEDATDRGDLPVLRSLMGEVVGLGDRRTAHAGMVRCIACQTTGMTWEQIETFAIER